MWRNMISFSLLNVTGEFYKYLIEKSCFLLIISMTCWHCFLKSYENVNFTGANQVISTYTIKQVGICISCTFEVSGFHDEARCCWIMFAGTCKYISRLISQCWYLWMYRFKSERERGVYMNIPLNLSGNTRLEVYLCTRR